MNKQYQLAEVFHSYQGEGAEFGMPQFFIRFAGCSVGTYDGDGDYATCHTAMGDFVCDTNYRKRMVLTATEILGQCKYRAICITGGEPCDRDLSELVDIARERGLHVHVETSGTKWQNWLLDVDHLVVSPKRGYRMDVLAHANELRFVFNNNWPDPFDKLKLIEEAVSFAEIGRQNIRRGKAPTVYISPINPIGEVDVKHVKDCDWIFGIHPEWRLSVQMHKFLGVR